MIGVRLRRDALVVVRERPDAPGERGIGGDVHELAPVAKLPAVLRMDEGGARVGLLHPEDAVELDGVTDRLVHLELHLAAVEHQRRDLARALLRGQQLDGLRARPLRLVDEAEPPDVLPPRGGDVAPEGVGERTTLDLALAERRRLDPAARLHGRLIEGGSLAGREARAAAKQVQRRLRERDALDPLHPPARLHQQRDLLLERNVEGVLLHRGVPRRHRRFDRREVHRVAGEAGGRARDLHGERGGAIDLRVVSPRGRGESPPAVDQDADAEARGSRPVDALHLLVANGQRLRLVGAGAGVRVLRAGRPGGLDRLPRHIEHPVILPFVSDR